MKYSNRIRSFIVSGGIAIALSAVVGALFVRATFFRNHEIAAVEHATHSESDDIPRVEVIRPSMDAIERVSLQPGSAQSFESAELFAKISGYLKTLSADIGMRVRQGDVLAEIDVPELIEDVQAAEAALAQARAEVLEAEAAVENAIADHKAAEGKVVHAKVDTERYQAVVDLSQKQLSRFRELNGLEAIENRVVDEQLFDFQSAKATLRAAETSVVAAELLATASQSRISLAKAQLEVVRSKVAVVESQLSRTKVMLSYTKVISPYNGVITRRNFHRGAFVRSPDQGGQISLLTVNRTDQMRVVVRIPERHIPFVRPGSKASIHFDAFPKTDFHAVVSRIASSEDSSTRTMIIEIDLPNPEELIQDNMYGRVEIALNETLQGMTIPSICLVGDTGKDKSKVFVLNGELLNLREISIGKDSGVEVEVIAGLGPQDLIVVHPESRLEDGVKVVATALPASVNKAK